MIVTTTIRKVNNSLQKHNSSTCSRIYEIPDFLKDKDITGAFEYQAGDQQLWHSNSNSPGARCYLVYSETGDSGMRFILDGKVYTSYDKAGWCFRIFNVPQPHCVFANCLRRSYGWRLPKVQDDEQIIDSKELENAEDILLVT